MKAITLILSIIFGACLVAIVAIPILIATMDRTTPDEDEEGGDILTTIDSNISITTDIPTTTDILTTKPVDEDELRLAEPCDRDACQLPDCICSSTEIPGGLSTSNTPQFVLVTFDDAVHADNVGTFKNMFYNRKNSNGCHAGTTFYVSHEYTNYYLINELYNEGFEIALHSISHRMPQDYWATATYEELKSEFGDQIGQISYFANIPKDHLKGIRIPFLQMTGNTSFQVMADYDILYDATWPTINYRNPGLWPYTLDYATIQECQIAPCPTAAFPGLWMMPMIAWVDLAGASCLMADSCINVPSMDDEAAWYNLMISNFNLQYNGNRAPFGVYLHEVYLEDHPAVKSALDKFMSYINSLNDAFMVNSIEVIEWIQNPISVEEYRRQPCRTVAKTECMAQYCELVGEHNSYTYSFTSCQVCPRVYPWTGNPFGE